MRSLARAATLLFLLLAPAAALALPPVWVVHDQDSDVTLFGSVHLLPQGVDWRPPQLDQALAGANDVWFEAPMDAGSLSAATQTALQHAFLPEGQTLQPMLSAAGRERLAEAAKLVGVQVQQFDRLQPWYAELLISSAMYQEVGVKASDGVEQTLWATVPNTAARHAFETPQEQVGFFADAPLPDQVASLEETLKDLKDAKHDYQVLLKAWLAGDLKTLDREVVRPLRKTSPALFARLVDARNARWTESIVGRLHGSGHTVVVVGMGHLIGPGGLPALLRARGYQVDGPH